jgi:Ca2+-binding RTX toxin-like protein
MTSATSRTSTNAIDVLPERLGNLLDTEDNTPLTSLWQPNASAIVANTQKADLVGTGFDVMPEPLSAGDSFSVDLEFQNSGSANAGPFDVSFYISTNATISTSDFLLDTISFTGLSGSTIGTFTANLALPGVNNTFWNGDGTYYIGMIVDSGNAIDESNENNNSSVGLLLDYDDVAISGTQQADLVGADFDLFPEPLNAGDSFSVDLEIENNGGTAAGAFDVSFYLSTNDIISTSDLLLDTVSFTGLSGNSSGTFTADLALPGVNNTFWNGDGTYYIGMIVDSGNAIAETDESNNSNVGFLFDYDDVVINNTQQADLAGTDFNVLPEPLNAGNNFSVDIELENSGLANAGPFDVSFYLSTNDTISTSDLLLDTVSFTGLGANSSGTFTANLALPGINDTFWNGDGTYYIGMIVDSGNAIAEIDESNNSNVGFLLDYDDVAINNTELSGTEDRDVLTGTQSNDTLFGLRGDDDLFGNAGNDYLFGDRGDDTLVSEAGFDTLEGGRGDDYLYGGTEDDLLFGGRGDDILVGIEFNAANPGLGEIDVMVGGFGADLFALGGTNQAYYNDGNSTSSGFGDYALIEDFDTAEDIILLHGSPADYALGATPQQLPNGIGIFLQTSGQSELIGIVQGASNLNLNSSAFSFA